MYDCVNCEVYYKHIDTLTVRHSAVTLHTSAMGIQYPYLLRHSSATQTHGWVAKWLEHWYVSRGGSRFKSQFDHFSEGRSNLHEIE